ncbi:class I SAM-dependent methyltransferase [Neomoorella glycerini]|uniref:class I SAM-dependent methyltransferase n=1 Tax=Neomoorella glycerini TaxID=55779 RepID=UPI00147936CC|nr:class I SAM-dependent methyltransferase [Moorella glycerini]
MESEGFKVEINVEEFDRVAREVFAPVYPVIAEQIKQKTGITKGTCLDIGCGGGYLGIALAGITELYIYLFDKSPEMLEIATRNIAGHGLQKRARTLLGDVHEIPLKDQSVDLVISRGSIFFWENQQKAFQEIYRVLAPQGAAFIGGGFGNAELKKLIDARMVQKDSNWQERINKNIGENAVESFVKTLGAAGISKFEINRGEAGLWITIWK